MKLKKEKLSKFLILVSIPLFVLGVLFACRDYFLPERLEEVYISQDFPDASAFFYNDSYYAYSTRSWKLEERIGTPVVSGESFDSYEYLGNATPNLPSWVQADKLPQAPEVFYDGKQFVMITTAFSEKLQQYGLGVGTSDRPEGPFEFADSPFLANQAHSILDASHFKDKGGQDYILYATDGAPYTKIYIVAVKSTDYTPIGKPIEILSHAGIPNPKGNGKDKIITRVEGPQLLQAPDGTYVLLFSANDADKENYFTGYATSKTLTGTYTYKAPLATTKDSGTIGPGGMSLITGLGSKDKVVFHGWIGGTGFYTGAIRQLYVADLKWESGHIPKLEGIEKVPISAQGKVAPTAARARYNKLLLLCFIVWLATVSILFYRFLLKSRNFSREYKIIKTSRKLEEVDLTKLKLKRVKKEKLEENEASSRDSEDENQELKELKVPKLKLSKTNSVKEYEKVDLSIIKKMEAKLPQSKSLKTKEIRKTAAVDLSQRQESAKQEDKVHEKTDAKSSKEKTDKKKSEKLEEKHDI